jgi:hypothetical protein
MRPIFLVHRISWYGDTNKNHENWYLKMKSQYLFDFTMLNSSKIAGTVITAVFLVGTTIATGIISQHNELGISTFRYYHEIRCTKKIGRISFAQIWGLTTLS